MRHPHRAARSCGALALLLLAACGAPDGEAEVERALRDVNVIDESGLSDVMMTVADPDEAVAYYARTAAGAGPRGHPRHGVRPRLLDGRRGRGPGLLRTRPVTLQASPPDPTRPVPRAGGGRAELAGRTLRQDRWWLQPLITVTVYAMALLYSFPWLRIPEVAGVALPFQRLLGWFGLGLVFVAVCVRGRFRANMAVRLYLGVALLFFAVLGITTVTNAASAEAGYYLDLASGALDDMSSAC